MGNDKKHPHPVEEESQEPAPPEYEAGPSSDQHVAARLPEYEHEAGPSSTAAIAARPPEYTGGKTPQEIMQDQRRRDEARRRREGIAPSLQPQIWDLETWRRYIEIYPPSKKPWDERNEKEKFGAASSLFFAISQGQEDLIAFLIENGIVTANTKRAGHGIFTNDTPLLQAISDKNVRVVQMLLDLGADKEALGSHFPHSATYLDPFGGWNCILRTPLQLAASIGHLVLVKLLMEQYHCDDSIVAPDGQIALRLAADNGHQEVVDYLPPRRLGGFRRWKFAHRIALGRAIRAVRKIGFFLKVFYWYIPKFFLWDLPKWAVVEPISKGYLWCWRNRKAFGPWCKQQLLKVPERATQFVKWIGRGLAKIPQAIRHVGQACWKFGTETLPRWIRNTAIWLWKLVTQKIPKALGILARWISNLITSSAKAIWNMILKIFSFLSTVIEAVISFLRSVTLADVWNGFLEVLKAVFVTFPKMLLSWIKAFGAMSQRVMIVLFGTIGDILWWIGYGLLYVILYIPRQLWKILKSFGESFIKAFHELRVWFDPKTIGTSEASTRGGSIY